MKHLVSFAVLAVGLTIAASAMAGGVDELPPDIQKTLYNKDMLDPMQPIGESAYRDWKPKKGPPWKIGCVRPAAMHRSKSGCRRLRVAKP